MGDDDKRITILLSIKEAKELYEYLVNQSFISLYCIETIANQIDKELNSNQTSKR